MDRRQVITISPNTCINSDYLNKIAIVAMLCFFSVNSHAYDLSGTWQDRSGLEITIKQTDDQLKVTTKQGVVFNGQINRDNLRVSKPYRRLSDVPTRIPGDMRKRLYREGHEMGISASVTKRGMGIDGTFYLSRTIPSSERLPSYSVNFYRKPVILGIHVIPPDEEWLPPLPGKEKRLLYVYGKFLKVNDNDPWLKDRDIRLHYHSLAYGKLRDPKPTRRVLRVLGERNFNESTWTQSDEGRRITKNWQLGQLAVGGRIPAGPHQAGHEPMAMLVVVNIDKQARSGQKNISLGETHGVTSRWTLSALASLKRQFCPEFLRRSVKEDNVPSIAGKMANAIGPLSMRTRLLLDYGETLATRLEQEIHQHPEHFGERAINYSVAEACPDVSNYSEEQNKKLNVMMTAEYYWSKKRLRDGILSSMESIAALEKLEDMQCTIGSTPSFGTSTSARLLKDTLCNKFDVSPGGKAGCLKLKRQCTGTASYAAVNEQSEIAVRQLNAIDRQLDIVDGQKVQIRTRVSMLVDEARSRELRAEYDKLTELEKQLKNIKKIIGGTNPWIEGSQFKSIYNQRRRQCLHQTRNNEQQCDDQTKAFVCEGIKAEATKLKQTIYERLEKFRQAAACLEGRGTCQLSTSEFREITVKAPPLVKVQSLSSEQRREPSARIKHLDFRLTRVDERRTLRGLSDEVDEAYKDFFIGVALTVATAGFGSYAQALRAGAAAANTARAANISLRVARGLELAAIGLDVTEAGHSLYRGISQCGNVFNRTTEVTSVNTGLQGPQCPSGEYSGARLVGDYNSCVLKTVAWELTIGLLPAIPMAGRNILNRQVLNRASRALGHANLQNLSKAQRNALLAVFRQNFTRLTDAELANAIKTLRKHFNNDEIKKLLGAFAPDVRRVGNHFVRGLRGNTLGHTTGKIGGYDHLVTLQKAGNAFDIGVCTRCKSYLNYIDEILKSGQLSPARKRALEALRKDIKTYLNKLRRTPTDSAEFSREMSKLVKRIDKFAKTNIPDPAAAIKSLKDSGLSDDVVRSLMARGSLGGTVDVNWLTKMLSEGKLGKEFVENFTRQASRLSWEKLRHVVTATGNMRRTKKFKKLKKLVETKISGFLGERATEGSLVNNLGHEILEREYKFGRKSFDLISKDRKGRIVFSEVKNLSGDTWEKSWNSVIKQLEEHGNGVKKFLGDLTSQQRKTGHYKQIVVIGEGYNKMPTAARKRFEEAAKKLGWKIYILQEGLVENTDKYLKDLKRRIAIYFLNQYSYT